MRRVTRHESDDGPLLEEQETEGQRQLHSLLLQQLDTDVSIEMCVAKRKCFAPASLYRPFGEQASGVRSLSQFQALQDGEQELASLRELGLSDPEILLWQSREQTERADGVRGVCAAPGAKQQRLQVILDKMEARVELMSRPQRFNASRPLSRREMEIERALFHGNHRLGFLTSLYHHEDDTLSGQQGAASSSSSSSDQLDALYRDVLSQGTSSSSSSSSNHKQDADLSPHQSQASHKNTDQSQKQSLPRPVADRNEHPNQSESTQNPFGESQPQGKPDLQRLAAPKKIKVSQPIGSLCGAGKAGPGGPLTIRGEVDDVPEEEILRNRDTVEEIRNIPRFQNYQPGEPSKVLCVKNLSAHALVAQLVALFSRFEGEAGPPVVYRLLTGRLKGQAFITLPDRQSAQGAMQLINGFRLLGKPLVMEFGRERKEEGRQRKEEKEEEERKTEKKRKEGKRQESDLTFHS
ncbi:RNA-binding protein 41 [Aplochiton taeniatus]